VYYPVYVEQISYNHPINTEFNTLYLAKISCLAFGTTSLSIKVRRVPAKMQTDYETMLRTMYQRKGIKVEAELNVDNAYQALVEQRVSLPSLDSLRMALHDATQRLGVASAELFAHQQKIEYRQAQNQLVERRTEAEESMKRGVPTKRWSDLQTFKERKDGKSVHGPILLGAAPAPHTTSTESEKSFLWEILEESPAFATWSLAMFEKMGLPVGSTVMLFTGLDHVVNNSPFRWKIAGVGFFCVLYSLGLQLFVADKYKAGLIKSIAIAESKFELPAAIALLECAIQHDLESNSAFGSSVYLMVLALVLAYDPVMLAVVGPLIALNVQLMQEGLIGSQRQVRNVQKSPGYDIVSPDKEVAKTSAQEIEKATQRRSYLTLLPTAAIIAATSIGLTRKPHPESGLTYGQLQASQMLPAILTLTTGASLLVQATAIASAGLRLQALVDGELLKLERKALEEAVKKAETHKELRLEKELRSTHQAACEGVKQCSDAVRAAESEEFRLLREWEDCKRNQERAQIQYNDVLRILAAALQQ
jgi:hypothetical protein